MIDPMPLWDFEDPVGSEQRFREAAEQHPTHRAAWLTQAARALGLQEKYADGHAQLDVLTVDGPEVETRVALERGRLLRSAGDEAASRSWFEVAAASARSAAQDELLVDALHMAALVAEPDERVEAHLAALHAARTSADPRARDWDASILNNLGMVHAHAGDHRAALAAFEEALDARERIGDVARIRVARWMVAWSLRHLGRREEALALQRALQGELAADGQVDSNVEEEISLLQG